MATLHIGKELAKRHVKDRRGIGIGHINYKEYKCKFVTIGM